MSLKTRFIVNPFSGVSQQKKIERYLKSDLDTDRFEYEISYTQAPGHATELAREAVAQGMDVVVAVGGDGSVNEVAAALIDTSSTLGILPAGSGNGLAMHLGLGRDLRRAIQKLNSAQEIKIDTCLLNKRPYVNLAGVGLDAEVAIRLKQSKRRGFLPYFHNTIKELFSYQSKTYELRIDGELLPAQEYILIEVANAPMFGYNFEVAPLAKFDDGLLEVVLFRKSSIWKYVLTARRFLDSSIHESSIAERYSCKELTISGPRPIAVHVDGEGDQINDALHFEVKPLSLKVLAPPQG